jgi:Na+-transporting methylmalonyl-CoA/oxaloacetate decarboxylase beta subunit
MENKKKIIILTFLGIIIIICVLIIINVLPSVFLFKEASTIAIIEGDDSPTTIYIGNESNWKLALLSSILLFGIDLILLAVKKIIEYKRKKNINIIYFILFIFNVITVLVLFPATIIKLLIINVVIIALIYLIEFSFFRRNNG